MNGQSSGLGRLLRKAGGLLLGHDIFVSYAREEQPYVRRLQRRLEQLNLWTFVDYEEIPAGQELRRAIRRALRRSRMLVVVGTRAATASPWVKFEVEQFATTGRPLVPINVDGQLQPAALGLSERELVWIAESAIDAPSEPSTEVIDGIVAAVAHTRRRQRMLQIAGAVVFVLGIITASAVWNWRMLVAQRSATEAHRLVALARGEREIRPAKNERAALVLLESIRLHESPEAADGLFASLYLMRPMLGSRRLGRILTDASLSPDKTRVLVSGRAESTNEVFTALVEVASLAERWRHAWASDVGGAEWSPDGGAVAVRMRSAGPVTVLDAQTGHEIARLDHEGEVVGLAFSVDGRWAATGDLNGTVSLWRRDTWTLAARSAHANHRTTVLRFDPEGWLLAGLTPLRDDGGVLATWHVGEGLSTQRLVSVGHGVTGLAVTADGGKLAVWGRPSTTARGLVTIVDWPSLVPRSTFPLTSGVQVAALSPSGDLLATAHSDGTARLWETRWGNERGLFAHRDYVSAIAFAADDQVLTASWDGTARLWAVPPTSGTTETFRADRELARMGHDGWVSAVELDSARARLVTTSHDGFVRTWSTINPNIRVHHSEMVLAVAPSPDGRSLATAGGNYQPGVWALDGGTAVRRLARHDNDLTDLGFDEQGRFLAVADSEDSVFVHQGTDAEPIWKLPVRASRLAVTGGLVVTVSNRRLGLWDAESGGRLEEIETSSRLTAVAARGGRWLVVGDVQGTVRLLEIRQRTMNTLATVATGAEIRAVAIDHEGQRLATADVDGAIRLWRLDGLAPLASLRSGDELRAIAFDRSGGYLASGGASGAVSVWSVGGLQEYLRFSFGSSVTSVAFSTDAPDLLFFGGPGGFGYAPWRFEDLVQHACALLARASLSDAEQVRLLGAPGWSSPCNRTTAR